MQKPTVKLNGFEVDDSWFRTGVLVATAFCGVTATVGGLYLTTHSDGSALAPLSLLDGTAFSSFFIPGLLLCSVVGASNLVASWLVLKRNSAAVDGIAIAGAALTIWIVVEITQIEAHWLQALYLGLGVFCFALGIRGMLRRQTLRDRWLLWVTCGEALGFLVPLAVGVYSGKLALGDGLSGVLIALAGFAEGWLLGFSQAQVWPLPLNRGRYALLTGIAASFAWACGMLLAHWLPLLAADQPRFAWVLGPLIACLGLLGMGGLQCLELARHVPNAHPWIGYSTLAWILALPFSFAPSPLVDQDTAPACMVALWAVAGCLMAFVMAAVTYLGVRRLSIRT